MGLDELMAVHHNIWGFQNFVWIDDSDIKMVWRRAGPFPVRLFPTNNCVRREQSAFYISLKTIRVTDPDVVFALGKRKGSSQFEIKSLEPSPFYDQESVVPETNARMKQSCW